MSRKPKIEIIYYAHSKRIYGTDAEKKEIETIRKAHHTAKIDNPPELFNSEPTWHKYMEAEFPKIDLVIFSDYRGYIGKGVHYEIEQAKKLSIPVKYLDRKGKITKYFRLSKVRDHDWVMYCRVMKLRK